MKTKSRRFISALLTLCTVFALVVSMPVSVKADAGLENFTKTQTYISGQFTDVGTNWYADSVKLAYELGLVKGTSSTTFSPSGNMTVAEAIALACRLHSIYYNGFEKFVQGSPWYQVYVDYALKNVIITEGQFSSYTAKITRRQFAMVFAKALPSSALGILSTVSDNAIPDVSITDEGATEIYKLYRAGILTGNEPAHEFEPDTYIQRSQVAAIVTRMAVVDQRVKFSLGGVDTSADGNNYSFKLNHEYGPLTFEQHYPTTGAYWNTIQCDSLVFTVMDDSINRLTMHVKGSIDKDNFQIKVRFYDANGNMIEEATFLPISSVGSGSFEFDAYATVNPSTIRTADHIKFVTSTGESAK